MPTPAVVIVDGFTHAYSESQAAESSCITGERERDAAVEMDRHE